MDYETLFFGLIVGLVLGSWLTEKYYGLKNRRKEQRG